MTWATRQVVKYGFMMHMHAWLMVDACVYMVMVAQVNAAPTNDDGNDGNRTHSSALTVVGSIHVGWPSTVTGVSFGRSIQHGISRGGFAPAMIEFHVGHWL